MGLFKSIVQTIRKPVAAVLGGHAMTGAIARLAPKVLGLKSSGAQNIVAKTQKVMLAAGSAALAGGQLKSILPSGPSGTAAVTPRTPAPVNNVQEAVQERFIRHILKG
jgi:hypothetical protein